MQRPNLSPPFGNAPGALGPFGSTHFAFAFSPGHIWSASRRLCHLHSLSSVSSVLLYLTTSAFQWEVFQRHCLSLCDTPGIAVLSQSAATAIGYLCEQQSTEETHAKRSSLVAHKTTANKERQSSVSSGYIRALPSPYSLLEPVRSVCSTRKGLPCGTRNEPSEAASIFLLHSAFQTTDKTAQQRHLPFVCLLHEFKTFSSQLYRPRLLILICFFGQLSPAELACLSIATS